LGLLLCLIEGVMDIVGLRRELSFESKFDFSLLTSLKTLLKNDSATKSQKAFDRLTKTISKNRPKWEAKYGKETIDQLLTFMKPLDEEMRKRPSYALFHFEDYQEELQTLTHFFLMQNLATLQKTYLALNPEEVKKVLDHVKKKHPYHSKEELFEVSKKKLEQCLMIKAKKLSRRIRPWMVPEAADRTLTLLPKLQQGFNQKSASEGLLFFKDLHIQSNKKCLVHMIGMAALTLGAVSMILLLFGCPFTAPVPLIFMTVATIVGAGRFVVFSGSLDVPGWSFSFLRLLPSWVSSRISHELPRTSPLKLSERRIRKLDSNSSFPYSSPRHG